MPSKKKEEANKQLSFGDLPASPGPVSGPAPPSVSEPRIAPAPIMDPPTPRIHTVSELVSAAAGVLEGAFGDTWVEGEISGLSKPASGHIYFTLKDDKCALPCVMWRGAARRLRFRMEQGLQLRCRGNLSIYDKSGKFQFYARSAEPAGLGELQLAFEQLKKRLAAEGLFDDRHKKPLPRLPRKVAVVTSPTGAAVRDIIRVLHARFPLHIVICPTRVQGEGAAAEIANALGKADGLGADLIIVGRGGGSLEDLWAFNEEEVARAIFAATTPVISAVGHEVDTTIADFVADLRAATPSNAAELAVPVLAELEQQLAVDRRRLERGVRSHLRQASLGLSRLRERLERPDRLIHRSRQNLDDKTGRLEEALAGALSRRGRHLQGMKERLSRQEPRVRLSRLSNQLNMLEARANQAVTDHLEQRRARLGRLAATLQALSPLGVLARGYSLVFDQKGRLIKEAGQLKPGDKLKLRLHQGQVEAKATKVES